MMEIGRYGDAVLKIPESAYFSFFNSPYIGHRTGTAVDVYYENKVLYPLEEGRVLEIRRVNPPRYIPVDEDYLMVIKYESACLKILHVKPEVSVGEQVSLGDALGEQILSGFFRPWSDRHAHFELRNCDDAYRARGAYPLLPRILKRVPLLIGNTLKIVERKEHYVWAEPVRCGSLGMTPLGEVGAWVEGGLPHYGYGAIYGRDTANIFGHEIRGNLMYPGVYIFSSPPKFLVDGHPIRGIGVYSNQKKIKILDTNFSEDEEVQITIAGIQN